MSGSERVLILELDTQAKVALTLRRAAPEIVREIVEEIRRQLPEYAPPAYAQGLELTVAVAFDQFADLIERPGGPSARVLDFFRKAGAAEAAAGHGPRGWQTAMNIGARISVRHFTEAVGTFGIDISAAVYSQVISETFGYLHRLADAMSQGHADAGEGVADLRARRRAVLLDRLVGEPQPTLEEVRDLAREVGWPVPRYAAAVALKPGDHWSPAPPDVLTGRDCLIVPDPEGPGRRRALEAHLRGEVAAIGPTVPVERAGQSLRWARRALVLATKGLLPQNDGLIVTTDHLPALAVVQNKELVAYVAARRLRPLGKLRQNQRRRFAETLQAVLECGFHAPIAAERLKVHPQTIRLRIRKLDEVFGDQIHDPELHMEFLMALRIWLAADRAGIEITDPELSGSVLRSWPSAC
jgi:hypothetical protein